MPYNPISGQYDYAPDSPEIPLAFKVMHNMPATSHVALFNARRFSNTLFEGGFFDVEKGASVKKIARARKFGAYVGDSLESVGSEGFLFGKIRKIAEKTPFLKPSRVNNFSFRGLNRLHSVSALPGVTDAGYYTPFQGASFLDSTLNKFKYGSKVRARYGAESDSRLFSGGFIGRMSAMSKTYRLEARPLKNAETLAKLDRNLARLTIKGENPGAAAAERLGFLNLPQETIMEGRLSIVKGNRLKAISDSSSGIVTKNMLEYVGTSLNPSEFVGTRAYGVLEKNIIKALGSQLPVGEDKAVSIAAGEAMKSRAATFLGKGAIEGYGEFGVRSLGKMGFEALTSGEMAAGAKLLGFAGLRGFTKVLPGINAVATASLVYDLTKMAAQGIVSAGNFAKDAVKSMQGSIHKPLFGMGYQDNEVAATSRARGVMAIQNSRLNARSALGSEAALMAAHFG